MKEVFTIIGDHEGTTALAERLRRWTTTLDIFDMESTETKKAVEKEVIKINMHREQIKEALEQEEIGKLRRLCSVTVPNKLTLLDELIEKTSELMIDEEEPIGVVQEWIKGTRIEFQGAVVQKGQGITR